MRKGHNGPTQQPGDILVSDDERAVYLVVKESNRPHAGTSVRRVKDKEMVRATLYRYHEMKREAETRKAAKSAPITRVDQKTLNKVLPLLALGGMLPASAELRR
jgi:hypothetical protein